MFSSPVIPLVRLGLALICVLVFESPGPSIYTLEHDATWDMDMDLLKPGGLKIHWKNKYHFLGYQLCLGP